MTVAYFDESRRQADLPAAARPARSVWRRMLDRLVEARMQQARRELARYEHIGKLEPNSPALVPLWHRPLGD